MHCFKLNLCLLAQILKKGINMIILPAIDIIGGCAVRLYKGDYEQKTVYSTSPADVAKKFSEAGAEFIHLVDLDGAKSGETDNIDVIKNIVDTVGVKVEVGGGIRTIETIEKYISIGVSRVILGTAAIKDPELTRAAVAKYGEKIAVGADLADGKVAIKGWTETSDITADKFFSDMEKIGVKTVICTDISRDGAMRGTNIALYAELGKKYSVDIVASGGVSSMDDVKALRELGLYGAIIGKAYYTGAIDLKEAIEVAK